MKLYILSLLSILCLFSCNQKTVVDTEISEKIEPKETVKEDKYAILDSLTTFQLDSFFQIYRDSLLNFISKTKFDKDTTINNDFSQLTYGIAANDFPAFILIEDNSCYFKDSEDCNYFFYAEKNRVFELINVTRNPHSFPFLWTLSTIERRDVNFDNKLDIIVKRPIFSGSREITEYILITNPNFKEMETILTTYSLPTNPKNKTVISFTDGGNYGTNRKHISKWQGNSLVEIRRLDKTYEDKEGEILEEFVIKNGKEIKTKTQKLNQEKAELYFQNYN